MNGERAEAKGRNKKDKQVRKKCLSTADSMILLDVEEL